MAAPSPRSGPEPQAKRLRASSEPSGCAHAASAALEAAAEAVAAPQGAAKVERRLHREDHLCLGDLLQSRATDSAWCDVAVVHFDAHSDLALRPWWTLGRTQALQRRLAQAGSLGGAERDAAVRKIVHDLLLPEKGALCIASWLLPLVALRRVSRILWCRPEWGERQPAGEYQLVLGYDRGGRPRVAPQSPADAEKTTAIAALFSENLAGFKLWHRRAADLVHTVPFALRVLPLTADRCLNLHETVLQWAEGARHTVLHVDLDCCRCLNPHLEEFQEMLSAAGVPANEVGHAALGVTRLLSPSGAGLWDAQTAIRREILGCCGGGPTPSADRLQSLAQETEAGNVAEVEASIRYLQRMPAGKTSARILKLLSPVDHPHRVTSDAEAGQVAAAVADAAAALRHNATQRVEVVAARSTTFLPSGEQGAWVVRGVRPALCGEDHEFAESEGEDEHT
eukprot:TRINITY_DN50969_c0_g1_i1.p1 TRINITY_DN50969_c0_g1~~TRINITY_DN50969_c0_g1_i1.p1  ORF type:complete len:480 (+),score=114.69 TRINITY_DN50969_c0_g1_i1:83-1441(+)